MRAGRLTVSIGEEAVSSRACQHESAAHCVWRVSLLVCGEIASTLLRASPEAVRDVTKGDQGSLLVEAPAAIGPLTLGRPLLRPLPARG